MFAGAFDLDAAEAVVGGDGIDGDNVLDLVAGLVDQSLVQVVQRQRRARYRLLDTIRAYARQRLPEMEDPDRVRGRQLEFSVGLAGQDTNNWRNGRDSNPRTREGRPLSRRLHSSTLPPFRDRGYLRYTPGLPGEVPERPNGAPC